MGNPVSADPNRTLLGSAPSLNATQTIKPVQCPVCKTSNPPGVMFCVECGLIFDRALPDDAFAAPRVQLPCLVDEGGRLLQLRVGPNVLGRQGDLSFEDARVSRRHAEILLNPPGATVVDLGSTNGTTLNDVALQAHQAAPLAHGDVIALGGLKLTMSYPTEEGKTLSALSGRTASMASTPTVGSVKAVLVLPDREVPLTLGVHTFGRKQDNSLVISDPYVSGRHGQIEVSDEGVYLVDHGSTNGTFVNGARLPQGQQTQLFPGDEVRLGEFNLSVRLNP